MLNNVIGGYLKIIKEREFDFPFIALLRSQGFFDIHFTHGQVEFGKDFIAKKTDEKGVIQYSFQLKAGNINQIMWRNDIYGQVLEAVMSGLSHPNFDRGLQHQSVLVTTGRLSGNASLGMQDFNLTIQNRYQQMPVLLWDHEMLVDMLKTDGLGEFYSVTSSGHVGYGDFHVLYGKSLTGHISEQEIENHSRKWLNDSVIDKKRVLGATLESEIISQNCRENGFLYESIQAQIALVRVLMFEINNARDSDEALLYEIFGRALANLERVCLEFVTLTQENWVDSELELSKKVPGPGNMITYLVICARIMEISGLAYFLAQSVDDKTFVANFISNFILGEPGCSHIPSDRYAISIVLPLLVLKINNQEEIAVEFLRRTTIWLCDRYELGDGIASFEASLLEEITNLFGIYFDFFSTQKIGSSFLATVISDLAAFIGNKEFYCDVVNDIKATKIFPIYWQIPDNDDIFAIDGSNIVSYPSIEYADQLNNFSDYDFAAHIIHEVRTYKLLEKMNPIAIMTLMLLLRDRYFPTLWMLILDDASHAIRPPIV